MKKLNNLINDLSVNAEKLSALHETTKATEDLMQRAHSYAKQILPQMSVVREIADQIEPLLGEDFKPFPSYEDLLFSVQ